jgi:predicted ATPase
MRKTHIFEGQDPQGASMLDSIQIKNFRCLRELDVPLKPLTVLIGPNDSGKSVFLSAVRKLLTGEAIHPNEFWRQDQRLLITIESSTHGIPISLQSGGNNQRPATPLKTLLPIQLFQLPSQGVVMESQGHNDDSGTPSINSDGTNVPTLLDYYLRRDRDRFFATVNALKLLIPGLQDLTITTTTPNTRRLDLIVEKGLRIPADQTSTGVRLLLVFVAIAYHPSPPNTILLEEPENGIHPKRLADVLDLLRGISIGRYGENPAQVILTTHSPYLLDLVDPEQEQVLVFQRLPDGSRTAQAADTSRLRLFMDEFMLGEVWYNQGEEGLVAR